MFFHFLAGARDTGNDVNCLFLDLKKAFDNVSHSLFFYELSSLSLDSNVVA